MYAILLPCVDEFLRLLFCHRGLYLYGMQLACVYHQAYRDKAQSLTYMHIDVDRSSNCLLTCADDFRHVLFCHSTLYLDGNQLQQLPAAVFSGLTSLRSHVVFVSNENVCSIGDTGT